MKITGIEPQKRNKGRFSVFIDNTFSFGIEELDLIRLKLKEGDDITEEELQYIKNTVLFSKAQAYGLRLVSTHVYTKQKLKRKMLEKGYDEEIIEKTIVFLREYGYIDDKTFAAQFIQDCIEIKRFGKYRIINALREKGIEQEIVNELIGEIDFDEIERENILPMVEQKLDGDFEYKNIMKAKRYFAQRGYSFDVIDSAIRRVTKAEEDW